MKQKPKELDRSFGEIQYDMNKINSKLLENSTLVKPKELVEERDEIVRLITLCNDGNVNITEEKYSKVKNYLTQQRTELLEEILGVIDENRLQYPNLYGKYIQVKRYNEILIPKIKSEVIRLINKKDE